MIGAVERQGLTLIPLELYFKRGKAKVALALGKGKSSTTSEPTKSARTTSATCSGRFASDDRSPAGASDRRRNGCERNPAFIFVRDGSTVTPVPVTMEAGLAMFAPTR